MSRRGEIVIECDSPKCHAEKCLSADDLADTRNLDDLIEDDGWVTRLDASGHVLDFCPECFAEGK